ncbi:efflux system outer membrane lipoprotein [Candidatus Nitrosoglobus terrae]|uniref:Efflux system outer membrane lipoprotein n=2 Tax=Candidatus Nitrosoglobus terrae TaxID=1630141 RepID=A0A1Q2SL28_9GAMM|nr:efflux system outer membrane lipoprotein [Candidatus Nitrosoglobus terrae]
MEMEHTLGEAHEHEFTLPDWPKDRWWEQFESAELNHLIEVALADNPGLKAAGARLKEADSIIKIQGAGLLPFLEAEGELSVERLSENGVFAALNPQVAGLNLSIAQINPLSFRYNLDFWGRNRSLMEAALGRSMAEKAERAEVWLQLTTSIAKSYFHGLATYQQLSLLETMLAIREDLLNLSQVRVQSGLDDARRVMEATESLETTNKRIAGTKDLLEFYQYTLARLSGHGPDVGEELFKDSVTIPRGIPLPENLPIGLLAHRPDLTAAMYRAQAAAKLIKAAKAQFYPTINLNAFAGFNALTLRGDSINLPALLFSHASLAYGGGPSFSVPYFEGGRLRGELQAERAAYDNAVNLYNGTLLEAMKEVAESLSAWHQTRKILEAHHRLLGSARGEWRLTKVRVRTGLDDRREMLTRQFAVLDQKFALRAIEADELAAMIELIEALGGGAIEAAANPSPTEQQTQEKTKDTQHTQQEDQRAQQAAG